jgi:DNA-binding transcriptional LysR family regulator
MDLRSVDLNLLKTFAALVEERSVTRAAARLGLTQPAVSGMLSRLRDAFGDPLFVRTPRGVAPTPRALELAEPVKRVLADIEGMLTPASFDPATAELTLSIAATDYALRAVVIPFLASLRQVAPGVRLALHPLEDARVHRQLERGDVDLALLTPEGALPEVHTRVLFHERYVCAMRADHPDAATGALTLARFCALDHAIVSLSGGGFRGATDESLARLGRERRVVLSVPSFALLLDALRSSDLLALVPARLLAGAPGLAQVEPPLDVPGFTKVACWHARTHKDPARRFARSLLFQSCDRAPAPC